jgi:hypothetical protein
MQINGSHIRRPGGPVAPSSLRFHLPAADAIPNSMAFSRPGRSSRLTALKPKNGINAINKITATQRSPANPPPPIAGMLAAMVSPWKSPMTVCSTIWKQINSTVNEKICAGLEKSAAGAAPSARG